MLSGGSEQQAIENFNFRKSLEAVLER